MKTSTIWTINAFLAVILAVILILAYLVKANAFSPDGYSGLEPAQYPPPYPPGVYGPLPVPTQPPGMNLPRRNYWEYQPYPFPQEGGRWRFHGEPDPGYYRQGPRDRMYEEYRRCARGMC